MNYEGKSNDIKLSINDNEDYGNDTTPLTKKKSSVNWLKLCGINLLPFGIELCACAGFTYIPPIMLKNGFTERTLTVVMGIGPFISLFLVPVIGRWSDRCYSRFGRRRPFMFILGIIMLMSLLIIPFSNEVLINSNFVLAIGVILLDFSNQALMNPCKALIPDIFDSLEEQSSAFTVYSCMLSLGGCVGYFITSIDWESTDFGRYFNSQEKVVFSLLGACFFLLLILNLYLAKEIPIEKSTAYVNESADMNDNCNDFVSAKIIDEKKNVCPLGSSIFLNCNGFGLIPVKSEKFNDVHKASKFKQCLRMKSPIRSIRSGIKGVVCFLLRPIIIIKNCIEDFFDIPPILLKLVISCLFGWMGIMCHDMYYSDFVGQVIYDGKPHGQPESAGVIRYNIGVRMGSLGLLLQCLTAALYAAFVQEHIIRFCGKRNAYMFGMVSFTLSLFGTVLANRIILVNIFAAMSGFGLTAITTVPYSLVPEYFKAKEFLCAVKERGVGEDMAILDSAFYLSQIIPSIFLGYIVEWTGTSTTYMVVATICGAAATYTSFSVTFNV